MSRGPLRRGPRPDWGSDESHCGILHVDMDAFFASVELVRRPHLRGRPVIVGGESRGVVLAATYEARAFGVHSAMPMAQARRMCPQAIVLPPDQAAYRAASVAVMAILGQVTALVEKVSVDEAFLDVSGARRRLGSPTVIAEQIRERVRRELDLPCSVGIASTKFVAKLASGMAKPDGVLLIPRAATVPFLHSLPVGSLWGVGERTEAALARWGITTVAQLADSEVATVQRAVGKVAGAHLHDLAWGRDPRPVTPVRQEKSIGAESTLPEDTADRSVLETHLVSLADRTATQLRERGLVARTVSLKVRSADFRTLTRSRTLGVPTDTAREVSLAARELLAGVDLGGQAVRLVGVRAEGLTASTTRPLTLEESVDDGHAPQRRAEQAMDEVRRRFGAGAVRAASVVDATSRTSTILEPPGDLS
ncbi:DNA polymerase IV [Actinotalea sp. BY-33]|uniref:DNA polymerase IV n=1 Tax=Actinotalea soli TaxID=2819234 RepID=A0A939LRM2_9CELL|nr:DNA polymerase IV [Actinotalea soli]MBO1753276.1 DNA polymerase IV [Actinotalea soli]